MRADANVVDAGDNRHVRLHTRMYTERAAFVTTMQCAWF
jgi:hypothetical protein